MNQHSKIKIKQYIVLRHDISPAVACIGTAHGVLACYLKFKDDPVTQDWISGKYGPFYKVICKARDSAEWEAIRKWNEGVEITESSLNGLAIAMVFKPFIWHKASIFNELQLYG
jgi:hypothetical protein